MEPSRVVVTDHAYACSAPTTRLAHLGRSPRKCLMHHNLRLAILHRFIAAWRRAFEVHQSNSNMVWSGLRHEEAFWRCFEIGSNAVIGTFHSVRLTRRSCFRHVQESYLVSYSRCEPPIIHFSLASTGISSGRVTYRSRWSERKGDSSIQLSAFVYGSLWFQV